MHASQSAYSPQSNLQCWFNQPRNHNISQFVSDRRYFDPSYLPGDPIEPTSQPVGLADCRTVHNNEIVDESFCRSSRIETLSAALSCSLELAESTSQQMLLRETRQNERDEIIFKRFLSPRQHFRSDQFASCSCGGREVNQNNNQSDLMTNYNMASARDGTQSDVHVRSAPFFGGTDLLRLMESQRARMADIPRIVPAHSSCESQAPTVGNWLTERRYENNVRCERETHFQRNDQIYNNIYSYNTAYNNFENKNSLCPETRCRSRSDWRQNQINHQNNYTSSLGEMYKSNNSWNSNSVNNNNSNNNNLLTRNNNNVNEDLKNNSVENSSIENDLQKLLDSWEDRDKEQDFYFSNSKRYSVSEDHKNKRTDRNDKSNRSLITSSNIFRKNGKRKSSSELSSSELSPVPAGRDVRDIKIIKYSHSLKKDQSESSALFDDSSNFSPPSNISRRTSSVVEEQDESFTRTLTGSPVEFVGPSNLCPDSNPMSSFSAGEDIETLKNVKRGSLHDLSMNLRGRNVRRSSATSASRISDVVIVPSQFRMRPSWSPSSADSSDDTSFDISERFRSESPEGSGTTPESSEGRNRFNSSSLADEDSSDPLWNHDSQDCQEVSTSFRTKPKLPEPLSLSAPLPVIGGATASEVTAHPPTSSIFSEAVRHISPSMMAEGCVCDTVLLEYALLDAYGRFLITLPDSLLSDSVHLFFEIEAAFWWYDDFWYDMYPQSLPHLTLMSFGQLMCSSCPNMKARMTDPVRKNMMAAWREYCRTIPLRGCIVLNKDLTRCVVVRGWKGQTWNFPKGKIDESEEDTDCAIRETKEELGIDLEPYIDKSLFIERSYSNQQNVKLFVIPGISEECVMEPSTRKEIGGIKWVKISSLGRSSASASPKSKSKKGETHVYSNSNDPHIVSGFRMSPLVMLFHSSLCNWIKHLIPSPEHKAKLEQKKSSRSSSPLQMVKYIIDPKLSFTALARLQRPGDFKKAHPVVHNPYPKSVYRADDVSAGNAQDSLSHILQDDVPKGKVDSDRKDKHWTGQSLFDAFASCSANKNQIFHFDNDHNGRPMDNDLSPFNQMQPSSSSRLEQEHDSSSVGFLNILRAAGLKLGCDEIKNNNKESVRRTSAVANILLTPRSRIQRENVPDSHSSIGILSKLSEAINNGTSGKYGSVQNPVGYIGRPSTAKSQNELVCEGGVLNNTVDVSIPAFDRARRNMALHLPSAEKYSSSITPRESNESRDLKQLIFGNNNNNENLKSVLLPSVNQFPVMRSIHSTVVRGAVEDQLCSITDFSKSQNGNSTGGQLAGPVAALFQRAAAEENGSSSSILKQPPSVLSSSLSHRPSSFFAADQFDDPTLVHHQNKMSNSQTRPRTAVATSSSPWGRAGGADWLFDAASEYEAAEKFA